MNFSNNLNVSVRISTGDIYAYSNYDSYPTGSAYWLNVSDGSTYKINKGSFENSAVQFRRDEVSNSFVEGKFLVNALRENVTENLSIYAFSNPSPQWISGTTYAAGNFVYYLGLTYRRQIAGAGTTAPNLDTTNWILYSETASLKTNIDAVTNAVTNLHFYVEVTIENSKRVWTCQASDYTVAISNEFLHNRQALINVNLVRLPSELVYTV